MADVLAGAPAGAFAFLFQSLPPTLHIETAAASMNSANSAFTSSTSRVSVYRERESSIGNRAASHRGGGAQDTDPRAGASGSQSREADSRRNEHPLAHARGSVQARAL